MKKIIIGVSILLFINFTLLGYFLFLNHPAEQIGQQSASQLRVIFLNVGQGDSSLIQPPNGKNILIDGGPDRQIIYKLDQYIPLTHRQIDLMILTHPDPDHLNGLVEVLKRYPVKQIIYNGVADSDPVYLEWQKLIQEKGVVYQIIEKTEILTLDGGVSLYFIWPNESLKNKSLRDDNPGSIVMKLVFDQQKFLFTADADKKVETALLEAGDDLSADVLKVAHHGSKTSSSLEFLQKVKVKYAVISVGKNKFGHPSFRALRNLEKIGATILRTDEKGDIMFISDGQKLELKTIK